MWTGLLLTDAITVCAAIGANVVKKLVSVGCTLYPLVYSWLSAHVSSWGAVHERLRSEIVQLRAALLAMWESPSEAVRPLVLRMMEVVALTLTNDKPNPAIRSAARDELRPFTLRELPAHHAVL